MLLCVALIGVALYRVRAKYAEGAEGGEKKKNQQEKLEENKTCHRVRAEGGGHTKLMLKP